MRQERDILTKLQKYAPQIKALYFEANAEVVCTGERI